MQPILELEGLSKSFGGLMALTEIDATVKQGEVTGLIGPNGAGKTTSFNCITGLYKPSAGEIIFSPDKDTHISIGGKSPEVVTSLGIARTFQNIRLFYDLTVLDNVRLGCHCRTKSNFFGAVFRTTSQKKEEQAIIDNSMKWLSFVGLGKFALQGAASLDYGNQRRLEIARALATQPRLILLDEPAAGMNPAETKMLIDLIEKIMAQDISVILIEHDMKLVMTICNSVIVLDHGMLIAKGTPHEIKDDPQVITAYLGRGAASA